MKKFSTYLTASITALALSITLLPSVVLAGSACTTCKPATDLIQDFNNYLLGTADYAGQTETIPADEINQELKTSLSDAKKWHDDAYLGRFTFYHRPGSMDTYEFIWLTAGDDSKMYFDTNSSPPEEKNNTLPRRYGIFTVPMRLRDLTKIMLAHPKILPTLDDLFSDGITGYTGDTTFTLEKNSSNRLTWTIKFLAAGMKHEDYTVTVSAENKQSPIFNITQNT